jgi:hypothetical protein
MLNEEVNSFKRLDVGPHFEIEFRERLRHIDILTISAERLSQA